MEFHNCNLCGSERYKIIYRKARFLNVNNVICKDCGLVFVNPRPRDQEIKEFYKNKYRHIYSGSSEITDDWIKNAFKRANNRIDTLIKYIPLKNYKSVLDIGCCEGAFLKIMRDRYNYAVYGVEPSIPFSKNAQEEYGLDVFTGILDDFKSEKKFDLITLNHVLEHFANPNKMIRKIRQFSHKDSMIIVEVPNISKPYGGLKFFFQDAHLYTFSLATLNAIFIKNGFKKVVMFDVDKNIFAAFNVGNYLDLDPFKSKGILHTSTYEETLKNLRKYRLKFLFNFYKDQDWIYFRRNQFLNWLRSKTLSLLGEHLGLRIIFFLKKNK